MKSRKLPHEKKDLNRYLIQKDSSIGIVNKTEQSQVHISKLIEYENLAIEM